MTTGVAVGLAMFRTWRNGVRSALGGSIWAFRAVVVVILLTGVVWQWAVFMVAAGGLAGGDVAALENYVRVTFLLSFVMAGATSGLLLIFSTTSVAGLLAVLAIAPVSRSLRQVVTDGPIVAVAALVGLSAGLPYWWEAMKVLSSAAAVLLAISWFAVTLLGSLTIVIATRLLSMLATLILGMSGAVGRPLAVVASLLVVSWQAFEAAVGRGDTVVSRVVDYVAAATVDGRPGVGLAIIGALVVGLGAWRYASVPSSQWGANLWMKWAAGARGGIRSRPRHRIRLELAQLLRHPTIISLGVLNATVLLALILNAQLRENALAIAAPLLLVEPALILAMSSYGVTWRSHWIYMAVSSKPRSWIPWKWLATLAVSIGSATAVAVTAGAVLGSFPFEWVELLNAVLWFVSGMVAGALVPISREESFTNIATFIVGVGLSLGATWLMAQAQHSAMLIALVVSIVTLAFLIYLMLVRARERNLAHMY